MSEQDQNKTVPSWGLLAINGAYNSGELTFQQWMKLSREWSLDIIQQ